MVVGVGGGNFWNLTNHNDIEEVFVVVAAEKDFSIYEMNLYNVEPNILQKRRLRFSLGDTVLVYLFHKKCM